MSFTDRLKDPKFWGMILVPILSALQAYAAGSATWQMAVQAGVGGLIAGVLGLFQPQAALPAKAGPTP